MEQAKKVISGEVKVDVVVGGGGGTSGTGYGILKELNADIKLGKSKYGYYLIFNKKFYKAPNEKVTLAEAKKIIGAVNTATGDDTKVVKKEKGIGKTINKKNEV